MADLERDDWAIVDAVREALGERDAQRVERLIASSSSLRHYHGGDYPTALAILQDLLALRIARGEDVPGWEATDEGAYVDWDRLRAEAKLSSTEVACVDLARGFAGLERAGGAGPAMRASLTAACAALLNDLDRTATVKAQLAAGEWPSPQELPDPTVEVDLADVEVLLTILQQVGRTQSPHYQRLLAAAEARREIRRPL